MNWWIHDFWQAGRVTELISWVFWVLFSITLHELAHGWAALWQGDDTPRRLNRMTLNPLVQMGPMSLLVFALVGIAWGMMPVNPYKFRDGRLGSVYVALAGPMMNVVLAIIAVLGAIAWIALGPQQDPLFRNVTVFFYTGVVLNLVLAIFNLLPVPPLDGSRILAGLSRKAAELYAHPQAGMFGMFLVLIVFWSGIGNVLFIWMYALATMLIDLGGVIVGNPPVGRIVA